MIRYLRGNLFHAPAEAIVNPVNTKGVAGKGLALQFKTLFPENHRAYREACLEGRVRIGTVFVFPLVPPRGKLRYIVNFPTKDHWREPSRPEYIQAGLEDLVQRLPQLGISSIALPALGAGFGGLPWPLVRELIEQSLAHLPIEVLVYEPL